MDEFDTIVSNMKSLMMTRGFTLHSSSGTGIIALFDFVDENNIHCDISVGDDSFCFTFVTQLFHKLSSGRASPFTNDKHFDRLYKKFLIDVVKLKEN